MEGSTSGGRGGFDFIRVDLLADKIGASEPGLRFLLGLLVGYPFAVGYHVIVPRHNSFAKHLYFTTCGLLLSYFCFGPDTIHSMISVLVTYVIISIVGAGQLCLILLITFHMTYLIVAYVVCSSDSYDIKWTTPQCILCLRLMGLAWDLYDGKRKRESLSADQLTTYLDRSPGFLEICGYTYYFGGYLCGPQFPFRRYIDFIDNKLIDEEAERKGPSRFATGFKRLLLGIVFVVLFVTQDVKYRSDHPITPAFLNAPFWKKCIDLALWNQVLFFKYIFVWLLAEGSCMVTGLSYNGKTDTGHAKWDGVKNFSVYTYFTGYTFQSMVICFNINTNQWVSRYVFKRLRFLGNKNISHVSTLMFLAVWHGFYVGYFICFLLEFAIIMVERQVHDFFYCLTGKTRQELPFLMRISVIVFMAIFKWVGLGFSVVSFSLLRWRRIKVVYWSCYYYLIVLMALWILLMPLRKMIVKRFGVQSKTEKDHETEKTK